MKLTERITRMFAAPPAQKPKTYPGKTLGTSVNYLQKRDTKLEEYRTIYDQGGLISEAVDCYPLMMLSNGYRFEGSRAGEAETFLAAIDFEDIAWKTIRDSLVVKVGLAEKIPGRGETPLPIVKLDHRYPETFVEVRDDYGTLLGYKQTIGAQYGTKKTIDAPPEAIFRLDLGLPLIERAYDDIRRHAVVVTCTAKSIERHGFPRYHITVGEAGETIEQTVIDRVAKQFENLKAQHEMVTAAGVQIHNIDQSGVQNTKLYTEWSTQMVTAALGVPEEMLGLGRGVLTGEIRGKQFYDKIGTLQKRFARQFNRQVLDVWSGEPGAAKLVFNDVSPADETLTADLIQKLTAASGMMDPFLIITPQWCRKRLGIDEDEFQREKEEMGESEEGPGPFPFPPGKSDEPSEPQEPVE